jgi:hypothetical protein
MRDEVSKNTKVEEVEAVEGVEELEGDCLSPCSFSGAGVPGHDPGLEILRRFQDVFMELILVVESDHFIAGSPEGHEPLEVSVIQSCDLSYQPFCEPAVNKFLLFLQDQPVLKAPHYLVSPELEGTDQAVGVQVAGRGRLQSATLKFKNFPVTFPVFQGVLAIRFADDHNLLEGLVFVLHSDLQGNIKSGRVTDRADREKHGRFPPVGKKYGIIFIYRDAVTSDRVCECYFPFLGADLYCPNRNHPRGIIDPSCQPNLGKAG